MQQYSEAHAAADSKDALLAPSIREAVRLQAVWPRYLRVNTLLGSEEEAISELLKASSEGKHSSKGKKGKQTSSLEVTTVETDPSVLSLLRIPPAGSEAAKQLALPSDLRSLPVIASKKVV